jgi:hypothetical protein
MQSRTNPKDRELSEDAHYKQGVGATVCAQAAGDTFSATFSGCRHAYAYFGIAGPFGCGTLNRLRIGKALSQ